MNTKKAASADRPHTSKNSLPRILQVNPAPFRNP
jgi:hypothetical protein